MATPIEPTPNLTYSQTDAAALCGVSQRSLVERGKKRGYLSKLYHCFPGQFWGMVATAPITEPSKIRLTAMGVTELSSLIQNCSPEPPQLDSESRPIREHGAVVKVRLAAPKYRLEEYAESVWFLHQIDGAGEHQRLQLEAKRKLEPEQLQIEQVEAELVDSGELVTVSGSSEGLLSSAFEFLSESDRMFWEECERRKHQGKLMGRMLAGVTLAGMAEGEAEATQEYYAKSQKVATKKKA